MKKEIKELKDSHVQQSAQLLAGALSKGFDWFQGLGALPHWFPYEHQHISDKLLALPPGSNMTTLVNMDQKVATELVTVTFGHEPFMGIDASFLQNAFHKYEVYLAMEKGDMVKVEDLFEQFKREKAISEHGFSIFGRLSTDITASSKFLLTPPPDLSFVFKEILLRKTVGALVGPGGTGKSTFLIQLAMSIASGETLIPSFVPEGGPGSVLGIFCEEDDDLLHHRCFRIGSNFFPPESESVYDFNVSKHIYSTGSRFHIVSGRSQDLRLIQMNKERNYVPTPTFYELLAYAQKIEDLRCIILDPFSRLFAGNENDNTQATLFISLMEQLTEATKAGALLSHHTHKGSAFTGTNKRFSLESALHQDALRGASGITNGCRWQCNLQPLPGIIAKEMFQMDKAPFDGTFLAGRVCKQNYGPQQGPFYLEQKSGILRHHEFKKSDADVYREKQLKEAITKAVEEYPGLYTPRDFSRDYPAKFKEAGIRTSVSEVKLLVQKMILSSELFVETKPNKMNKPTEYLTTFSNEDKTNPSHWQED